jgi:hypothetical protein
MTITTRAAMILLLLATVSGVCFASYKSGYNSGSLWVDVGGRKYRITECLGNGSIVLGAPITFTRVKP